MSQSSYVIIERRHGETTVTRRTVGGDTEVLSAPPRRKTIGPSNGAWQLSRSNGFIGTEKELKKAMKLDAQLGRTISYRKTHESTNQFGQPVAAYAAEFTSKREKANWLRAHKRFDLDGGFGTPCPGDFYGKTQPECCE